MFDKLFDNRATYLYEENQRKIKEQEKLKKEFNLYEDTIENNSNKKSKKSLLKKFFSKNNEKEIEK